jgi:hypothetical protein
MTKFSEWFESMRTLEVLGQRPSITWFDIPALDGDDNLFDYVDAKRWAERDALKALEVKHDGHFDRGL